MIRNIIALLLLALLESPASAQTTSTASSIYAIQVKPAVATSSKTDTLQPYKGKVLLIVNVASECGYTPQYAGLQRLNEKYKDQGLQVLAFPCNDFGGQEPGNEQQILSFCQQKYGVTFPVFSKVRAKGPEKHPLFQHLTSAAPETGEIKWNFEKFIVGREGKIVARFRSAVKPDDPQLVQAIEKALSEK